MKRWKTMVKKIKEEVLEDKHQMTFKRVKIDKYILGLIVWIQSFCWGFELSLKVLSRYKSRTLCRRCYTTCSRASLCAFSTSACGRIIVNMYGSDHGVCFEERTWRKFWKSLITSVFIVDGREQGDDDGLIITNGFYTIGNSSMFIHLNLLYLWRSSMRLLEYSACKLVKDVRTHECCVSPLLLDPFI